MTGPARFFLHMLQNAHDREQLATCWKVFEACSRFWPDSQWEDVREAFKLRAKQMGLPWKGRT